MRLLPDFNKPGKGVSKDEKPPEGFCLFWLALKENYGSLILLNVLFILFSALIITFGPALKALSAVTLNMVRREPQKPVQTFFTAFKTDFLKTALTGIAVLAVMGALSFSAYYYTQQTPLGFQSKLLLGVTIALVLFFSAVTMYLFKSLAVLDVPLFGAIKNAVLLTIASPKNLLMLFVFIVIPSALCCLFPAVGGIIIILILFSLNSLTGSIISWQAMSDYIIKT